MTKTTSKIFDYLTHKKNLIYTRIETDTETLNKDRGVSVLQPSEIEYLNNSLIAARAKWYLLAELIDYINHI